MAATPVRRLGAGLAVAGILASGCGGAGGGPSTITLHDQDNGRTVTVARGAHLAVELASTYWIFGGSSNPTIVRQAGAPVVRPGGTCPVGGGCGTARASFDAVGQGQAVLTATRMSCGEARRCDPEQASYRVTVVVRS